MKLSRFNNWIKEIEVKKLLWLSIIVIINQISWLVLSTLKYRVGFPLDDAWIHQTYARNFVENFRWEYSSGVVSGGSTSPLWTILLMPGYIFKDNFFLIWTIFLGMVITVISAYIFEQIIFLINNQSKKYQFPIYGFIFSFEWHLIWAANSGMETILFVLIILLALYFIYTGKMYDISFAVLLGTLLWIRPDAVSFVFVYVYLLVVDGFRKGLIEKKFLITLGILLINIFIYMIFNKMVAGTIFPNTFYAKQAEYSVLYQAPIINRFINIFLVPITGIGAVLIPGFLYKILRVIKEKDFKSIAILLWFFGYMLLFALRLPVTYQHGRYFIPLIPIYLAFGISGYLAIKNIKGANIFRILIKSWEISAFVVLFIFWGLGANAYSQDVAIIEAEMVDSSIWINDHTSETAIIAAHDIGALGYFCDRQLIDLAGLISPEVIPIISNEDELESYLDSKNIDFIIVFPNWYDHLVDGKEIVYQGSKPYSLQAGGENMTIYKWKD